MSQLRGRFAPSPTGLMHLGNLWVALLSWLSCKAKQGEWVLRIEDLDKQRSKAEFAEQLQDDLKWLGLIWDEGPFYQSKRQEFYQKALDNLTNQNKLYPCFCTRAELQQVASAPHFGQIHSLYSGKCRQLSLPEQLKLTANGQQHSLRLKVPNQTIVFQDEIFGEVKQNLAEEVGDFIVQRSDGMIAYQLAVVVDDGLQGLTEVVRGSDLLDSTARQILLYNSLDLAMPQFIHVPLLFGEDGHRLSKRHGDLSLWALRKAGLQAEKIIGYLAMLAGLIDRFEAVRACDLLEGFTFSKVGQEKRIIPHDLVEKLKN